MREKERCRELEREKMRKRVGCMWLCVSIKGREGEGERERYI
jgi:hypothetical protein